MSKFIQVNPNLNKYTFVDVDNLLAINQLNSGSGYLFRDTSGQWQLTNIPTATSTIIGGVKLFSDTIQTVAASNITTTASRTYGIQTNSNGQLVVNVPWTNTTYLTGSLTELNTGTVSTGRIWSSNVLNSWINSKNYITDASLPTVGNGILSFVVPTGLNISGNFSANQSTNSSFNLSYSTGYQGYTTNEANKLANIESNANNYTLPISSASILGGVMIGSGLSINSSGLLTNASPNIIQTLSQSGQVVTLSNGGGSFTLPTLNETITTISRDGVDIPIVSQNVDIPLFSTTGAGLVPPRVGSTSTKYLREDGTWVTPTNTTYSAGTLALLQEGTNATNRVWSSSILNTWLSEKGYITSYVDTVTRLRGTATGTYTSGDITFIAGSNTSITQSGNNITISSTDTNTTYTGSTSISLVSGSFQRAALTGDVTSAQNSNATTIANNAVTFTKMQNISTQRLLGRGTAGTGNIEELTLGTGLALSTSGVLSATGSGGTVTSVAMSVPTGLTVTGSPITSSGTLAVGFASGYSLPTTTKQEDWDTAFSKTIKAVTVTGTTSKTITLTREDDTVLTANWADNNVDTITRLRGTTTGTYTSGDLTLLAGSNVTISQSGSNFTISSTNTTYTAGNGLTLSSGAFSMGTPSAISLTSTNSTTSTSHTHEFAPGGTTAQYIRGDGSLATMPTIPTVGNGSLSIGTPTGLIATGTFTANQSGNSTITLAYDTGYQGYTTAESTKLAGIAENANNYTLPAATNTILGGVKLFSNTNQSVAANAITSTASRTYGIQTNATGQLVVNVPWTDTNTDTTYEAGTLTVLNAAQSNVQNTWSSQILNQWLNGKNYLTPTAMLTYSYQTSVPVSSSIYEVFKDNDFQPLTNVGTAHLYDVSLADGGAGTFAGHTGAARFVIIYDTPNSTWVAHKISQGGGTSANIKIVSGVPVVEINETATKKIYVNARKYRYMAQSSSGWIEFLGLGFDSIQNLPTTLEGFGITNAAKTTTQIVAGNGLIGGGSLATNRTISLGTPGAITLTTSNSVGTTSHTHEFAPGGTTAQYIRGDGSLASFPSIPSGTITSIGMTTPSGLTVSPSTITSSGTFALTYSSGYQGYTTAEANKLAGISANANNYILPTATDTVLGGVKLFNNTNQTVAANTVTTTASRTYGIQTNASGQLVVNVPWVDTNTNTTYSAGTGITLSGTTFSHTAHTGDVTGSTALTIANNAVTFPKMQNIATQRLLGRGTAGIGNIEELTLGANLTLSTTGVLSATNTNTTYSAGTGLSLSGTTFGQAITISGSGTFVTGITQTTSGFQVNLGTPPNTNTTYSTGSLTELNTGTVTTGRIWGANVLNQWLNAKGFSTQTLTAGTNISIVGNVISATNTDTVTRLRGTATGTYTSGDLTLLAGTNTTITQSGDTITIASTNTNTTYSAGTGLSLTGTTFANTAPNATHTGDVTGATALTIANSAVTHAKYQNIETQRILGRGATGTGNVQELTLGANLSLSTTGILSATNTNTTYSASNGILLTGTNFTPVYGIAANTIAQGDDARINNGQTAFGWGNHSGLYALVGRSIVAGNGLSGGGTLAANRTITLGTPGAIGLSTTNSVTSTSHTHALDSATTTAINNGNTAFGWGDFRDYGLGITSTTVATALTSTTIDDPNLPNGLYHIASAQNTSFSGSADVLVMRSGATGYTTQKMQVINSGDVVKMYLRHYRVSASAWSSWREVITDENLDSQATSLGFIKSSGLSGYVPTSRTVTAGNGLTGGGALSGNITLTMGTPGAITLSSTSSVSTSSHTHAFTPGGTTAQYIRGDGSLATYVNTTYSAGTGLSLSGTTFGQAITTSGTGTYVQSITQTTSGFQVNLGTPPNTNTTYSNMAIAELNTGTVTSGRVISASVLNQWLNAKGFSTQTLTAGSNITISGSTISATNTNTTYSAGTGLTLTGTVFSLPVNITGSSSGNYVADVSASATGLTVTKGILPVSSLVTATTAAGVSNVATTNTNTFLNIVEGGASVGSSTQITGTGSVTVTSDAAGKLTINGTNTNTTYSGSTSIILSGTSFQRAALTGDVTASQNSNATTIAANAVTFTKMQNIATQKLLGRSTSGTGNIEEITLGTGLTLTGGVLSASASGSVSQATATVLGGVKLFSNTVQTVAATAVSATSGKTYGIQLNSSGQAVVNVPWSNTTYSSGTLTVLNAGTNSTSRVWGASILSDWLNGKGYLKSIQVNGAMVYTNGAGGNMRLFTNNNSGVFYADAMSGSTDIHFHMEDSRRYNFGGGPRNVDYIYEAHIGTPFSVPLMNGEKIYVAVYWNSNNMWHDPHSVPNDYLMDTYGVMNGEHYENGTVPIRGNIVLPGVPPHPYLCVFYYFGNGYCEIEFIGFVKLDDICAQKLNGLEYGVIILATFRREYGSLFVDPKIF